MGVLLVLCIETGLFYFMEMFPLKSLCVLSMPADSVNIRKSEHPGQAGSIKAWLPATLPNFILLKYF